MKIDPRIIALKSEVTAWRHDIHAHPELLYDVERTAAFVEEKLKSFGVDEVVPNIGRTGVVGIIHGKKRNSGKVIGLRADMDALPIEEQTNLPYRSKIAGKMHACGHDGHTAMLLGAAKYFCQTRDFDGSVAVIFQPAEEGGAGGKAMVDDGMMERFNIGEVYGLHNMPNVPVGNFATRPGGLMASATSFKVVIEGKGGHGAMPSTCIDPVVATAQIIMGLQTIASRNVDPLKSAVVSVTYLRAGDAFNVIPQTSEFWGTVRTLDHEVDRLVEERFRALVNGLAAAHGCTAVIEYKYGYPVTFNHAAETAYAASVAQSIVGAARVDAETPPVMGAEDFSFMLNARPGAFMFVGNGDSAGLHHPAYNFNDDVIPYGMSYWSGLVETKLAA